MIFSSIFLHAVTFSHVLHPDVVRSQIELKLKVKTLLVLVSVPYQTALISHSYLHGASSELAVPHHYCYIIIRVKSPCHR